ncbi:MAG TPA: TlpA disulfide reductase family protein [Verrucomicrobiae bacterium]|nr:TlpA disulfide reductase family protein [Verrucomicrobiae bacterium]
MKLPRSAGIALGVLFAIGTIAIHYQVKVVMHRGHSGRVQKLGDIKVGDPAPDFSVMDLSNHPVTLASYRGQKVVVMDFWATWCGPCRMGMPGLQDLHDKYKDRGLEVLSVNQGESANQVSNFIQRKKYSFHVVLDADGAVGNKYGVQAIPTLVAIDKQGNVRYMSVGYSENEDELLKLVDLLTESPPNLTFPAAAAGGH